MNIAIIVAGQVRTYDNIKQYGPEYIKKIFEEHGHSVDLYGVKWDSCLLPTNVDNFYKILDISNNEFEDWLKQDPNKRYSHNSSYANFNKSHIKTEEWLLESSKHACAQLYTFGHGLEYVIRQNKDYDQVIRWRWDLFIPETNLISRETSVRFLIELSECLGIEHERHGTNVLMPSAKIEESDYFPGDLAVIFDYEIAKKIYKDFVSIHQVIDHLNRKTTIRNRYSDHKLWRELMLYIDARVLCNIPEFVLGLDKNRK